MSNLMVLRIFIFNIIYHSAIAVAQISLPTFQAVQNPGSVSGSALYDFTSHTFTNCSATGSSGPTLSNCTSSYSTTWDDNTSYFNMNTQGIQEWTVPKTGSYTIEAWGGEGGDNTASSSIPGKGARMKGTFSLTSGQVLKILVGQKGSTARYIGGGGGGTFVWISGQTAAPLIAAGGGGGVGYSSGYDGVDGTTNNDGTNGNNQSSGGGTSGGGGTDVSGTSREASGGAGWLSNGNDGSDHGCTYDSEGGVKPLSGGTGGSGGGSSSNGSPSGGFGGGGGGNARCGAVGGGGGGGYSGGGAGAEPPSYSAGGGGGSYNSGSNQSNSSGIQEDHGKVTITLL